MKKCIKFCFPFFFVFCSCNSYPQIFVWIATIVWPLYRLAKIEILQLNGIRNTKIISYILWTKKKNSVYWWECTEFQVFFSVPLGKITSPKDVLWTYPYGPLCNAKWRPLPAFLGRWNIISWGHSSVTFWGRPHTVQFVTP